MTGTWVTDLTHFLDEDGDIAPISGPAWRLAEFFTSIVVMTSHPDLIVTPSISGALPSPSGAEALQRDDRKRSRFRNRRYHVVVSRMRR